MTQTTAIITGGANGIGAATAHKLLDSGARVALFDVNAEAGEALAAQHEHLEFVKADVTDLAALEAAVEGVVNRHGRVDVLVNSAGVAPARTLNGIDSAEWQRVMSLNMDGTFNAVKAVVPAMKAQRKGSIVNVSSIAGKNISLGAGVHYTTSKWAVVGMTRHLGYELAPHNIRVNAVCPGPALTSLLTISDEEIRASTSSVPLGRWVVAEDVANVIAFFASDASAMCTGTDLVVDGGALLGSGDTYPTYFRRRGEDAPERDLQYPEHFPEGRAV